MLKTLFAFFLLSIGLGLYNNSRADSGIINREYQLKTAYLFHFAELTEWPSASSVLTICTEGDTPLNAYLPLLEGKRVHDRTVHVMPGDSPPIDQCQILFISESVPLSNTVLESAASRHVLLVSDANDFAKNGGMIQFALRNNRLKLVVNLSSVKQAGLKLSSKLLRMAEILE